MEDLDPPRESVIAAKQILQALECLNLYWDGEVLYQSDRHTAYQLALNQLQEQTSVFPCTCNRKDIQQQGGIYQGNCRRRNINDSGLEPGNYAIRCKVSNSILEFDDLLQGKQSQNLESETGDFIIKRKDGLYSYQLAVVVDDAFQEITHIIRGIDLIDSSYRQIYLQSLLSFPQPYYGHIPVIINDQGQKLSKQHHATALDLSDPSSTLYQALLYLQQNPPNDLKKSKPSDILEWAIENWQIPKLRNLQKLDEK
jgi:glutamyl-Q tRNA(Asp) synthetase